MRYLLDTNTVISALNTPGGAVRFEELPLDTEDARHAGDIRAWLAAQGGADWRRRRPHRRSGA